MLYVFVYVKKKEKNTELQKKKKNLNRKVPYHRQSQTLKPIKRMENNRPIMTWFYSYTLISHLYDSHTE